MKTCLRQMRSCKNRETLCRVQGDRPATEEWQPAVHRDDRAESQRVMCSVPNEIGRGAC